MFFLNSVRRRLVTGLTVTLGLMLIIASVGILGLIWHQQSVSELDYVLYQRPDPQKLTRAFDEIEQAVDIHVLELAGQWEAFDKAVKAAQEALTSFRSGIEELKPSAELRSQRRHVAHRIFNMEGHLNNLSRAREVFTGPPQTDDESRAAHYTLLQRLIRSDIEKLKDLANKEFPAYQDTAEYQDRDNFVRHSLQNEQKRSARLLRFLLGMTAAAAAFYGVMVFCAFRWISNPISTISKGASRIAEGDHAFRVPEISGWNDEFSNLRTNVNLMADRFHENEENLNAKVRERSQQLIRSERLAGLGFLAAGVAHEINNPLSAIRMASDSLEYRLYDSLAEDDPDREEVLDRLAMIRRESARCGEITARILNFARGDESTMTCNCLTRVVEEVLAMVRPMPAYRDREIMFERTTPLMVTMNASQMKQVILNLVANSLQATPADGRVEVRLNQQVDWVVLEVEDNGCGMTAETLTHLFEPFYSTKQAGQGTGLGMSITHRIIENHNGTIEPVSQGAGQGSLFRVRLPMRQAERVVA